MPDLRGRIAANVPLKDISVVSRRRAGAASVHACRTKPTSPISSRTSRATWPTIVIGLGSNLLVRDGGVAGVVIRLGRGFGDIKTEPEHRLRVGTVVPDVKVARAAADAGIAGLCLLSRHSGLHRRSVAHERRRTRTRNQGRARAKRAPWTARATCTYCRLPTWALPHRHCGVPEDWIFTEALFAGHGRRSGGNSESGWTKWPNTASRTSRSRIAPAARRSRTPPGHSAWKLVDAAGCRGFRVGGAKVSDMHCNFLINDQGASAEDVERLGETVRARVKAKSGVTLEWEIIRLGLPQEGRPTGEALARSWRMRAASETPPPRTFGHVAVLMGGLSAERSISLESGTAVADALESEGYRVTRIDVGHDVARRLDEVKPEACFNALHGKQRRGRLHPGHPRNHGDPLHALGRAVVGAGDAQGARQGRDEGCVACRSRRQSL